MGVGSVGSGIPRRVALDLFWLLGGGALALLLLFYLHEAWRPWTALFAGLLGAVFSRYLVAPQLRRFPGFLRLNFELGTALVGVLLASWATLALEPTAYWVFRWRPASSLAVAAALLGLALTAMYLQQISYERVLVVHRDRADALREEALRAELKALQAQINPHFLFNALGALAELTRIDAEAAETLVQDLAHLLRYSLRSSSRPRVSLGRELEAVDRYLRIERARLGERLKIERRIDDGLLDLTLPGLVLQPLVENAVRHGISPRPEGGRILIEARREGDRLLLAVEDDGPGLPEEQRQLLEGGTPTAGAGSEGAGGGLANAAQRLTLSYRGKGSLRLSEANGTRLEIDLPVEEASS
jgi:sensor histidine kinase YesM